MCKEIKENVPIEDHPTLKREMEKDMLKEDNHKVKSRHQKLKDAFGGGKYRCHRLIVAKPSQWEQCSTPSWDDDQEYLLSLKDSNPSFPRFISSTDFKKGVQEETPLDNIAASDGGSNSFYVFPEWVVDVDSLCRYWELSSAEGNILKSLTANLGSRHSGTDKKREVRKSLHYSIERMKWEGFSDVEILEQVKKRLADNNRGVLNENS